MSASQACEGRRPCPWRRRRSGPEARHEWAGGADGRARGPFPRRLKGSGERAAGRRAVRLPYARHLRTAPCITVSAGNSLEGGHSLQPLHTACSAAPHKMAAPMEPAAAAPRPHFVRGERSVNVEYLRGGCS